MIRSIKLLLILGFAYGWISACTAQTDPKNTAPQTSGINPSGANAPSPLNDPKMPEEQKISLENQKTLNPSNPPVLPPDQKQPQSIPVAEKQTGPAHAEPVPSLPVLPVSSAPENEQPAGDNPPALADPGKRTPSNEHAGPDADNMPDQAK